MAGGMLKMYTEIVVYDNFAGGSLELEEEVFPKKQV
jgi:hypothetical protein